MQGRQGGGTSIRLESLAHDRYHVLKDSSTLLNLGVEKSNILPVSDVTSNKTCAPVRLDSSLAWHA